MIKHIITRGIGTAPGGPKYLVTAGFDIAAAGAAVYAAVRMMLGIGY